MLDSTRISNLKDAPQFLEDVAHAIWKEWWKDKDVTLEHITKRQKEALTDEPLPSVFAAHNNGICIGTISLIASDLKERPQYTPWLAALRVHSEHRGKGIAVRLMRELEAFARQAEIQTLYLCALPELRSFYEVNGWACIEEGVGELDVYRKHLS